jgi:hypothetical protein
VFGRLPRRGSGRTVQLCARYRALNRDDNLAPSDMSSFRHAPKLLEVVPLRGRIVAQLTENRTPGARNDRLGNWHPSCVDAL